MAGHKTQRNEYEIGSPKQKKRVPFVASVKPTGQNYLNYLMVKEQQRMKKSRIDLLNELNSQRHKFKHYL
jgi:hypothetical protein